MTVLRMITPPAADAFLPWVAELRDYRKADAADDAVLTRLLRSAVGFLDGDAGYLGRCLFTTTWQLSLASFPAEIRLPVPPLLAVESITYVAPGGGVTVSLPASEYAVIGDDPAIIRPAYGARWPATRAFPGTVTVTFRAGYGAAADIPDPIKQAIFQHVGTMEAHRESAIYGTGSFQEVPFSGFDLIEQYRMRAF